MGQVLEFTVGSDIFLTAEVIMSATHVISAHQRFQLELRCNRCFSSTIAEGHGMIEHKASVSEGSCRLS